MFKCEILIADPWFSESITILPLESIISNFSTLAGFNKLIVFDDGFGYIEFEEVELKIVVVLKLESIFETNPHDSVLESWFTTPVLTSIVHKEVFASVESNVSTRINPFWESKVSGASLSWPRAPKLG